MFGCGQVLTPIQKSLVLVMDPLNPPGSGLGVPPWLRKPLMNMATVATENDYWNGVDMAGPQILRPAKSATCSLCLGMSGQSPKPVLRRSWRSCQVVCNQVWRDMKHGNDGVSENEVYRYTHKTNIFHGNHKDKPWEFARFFFNQQHRDTNHSPPSWACCAWFSDPKIGSCCGFGKTNPKPIVPKMQVRFFVSFIDNFLRVWELPTFLAGSPHFG